MKLLKRATLELHYQVVTSFMLASRSASKLACKSYAISEVKRDLECLHSVVKSWPDRWAISFDSRMIQFRKARLQVKTPAEPCLIMEVPLANQEFSAPDSFPSYHDAALLLTREFVESTVGCVAGITEAERLHLMEMAEPDKIPEYCLGVATRDWFRFRAIASTYRAEMLVEGACIFEPNELMELGNLSATQSDQGLSEVPKANPPKCECGAVMKVNSGAKRDSSGEFYVRYYKCGNCNETAAELIPVESPAAVSHSQSQLAAAVKSRGHSANT